MAGAVSAKGALEVRYDAPPTLGRFLGSNAFVRCVVGPIGSGKSSACVVEILRRAMQQRKGPDGMRRSRWAIVRNTYRELTDTSRATFETWVPHHLGKWNEQNFCFELRFGDVEAEVLFRALDKPRDVKKLLSLELTGVYFNELREIAQAVFDGAQGRVGRYPSKAQGGASWFGVWGDTNPWHTGHWAHKLFKQQLPGYRLFRQPGGRAPEAENVSNLPADYYQRLAHGKASDWVRVYVDGLEASSDIGSIWGEAIDALEARGGLAPFQVLKDELHTFWDLGRNDSTAIWVARITVDGVQVVAFHQASGKGLRHYFDKVAQWEAEGFSFRKHWLPHDAAHDTLASQTSILSQCISEWGAGKVSLCPSVSVLDGIQASRALLESPATAIHGPNCAEGVEALREYRYEWDDATRAFSRRPLHNWASHPADAFRYLAVVHKVAGLFAPRPPPPQPPLVRPVDSFTLDELWETAPRTAW